MDSGQPSRTAISSAHARAVHQVADGASVFVDPLAVRIAGLDPGRTGEGGMPPAVRLFMAVRHRLAEDALATAVAGGIRQVVILGAGLDTFAYRNPYPGLCVFEVDRPQTQSWKRDRLAGAGIDVPGNVVHCPVDLDRQTLAEGLAGTGFDQQRPAFFIALGLVPYLPVGSVLRLMRSVARLDGPSEIVFDYNQPRSVLAPDRRAALGRITEAMARTNEPWQSSFTPDEIARGLSAAGFGSVEDLGWRQCQQRYAVDPALPDLFGGRIVHARRSGS